MCDSYKTHFIDSNTYYLGQSSTITKYNQKEKKNMNLLSTKSKQEVKILHLWRLKFCFNEFNIL